MNGTTRGRGRNSHDNMLSSTVDRPLERHDRKHGPMKVGPLFLVFDHFDREIQAPYE